MPYFNLIYSGGVIMSNQESSNIRTVGGPTSVINASVCGVFVDQTDCITAVYGATHGIRGMLEEEFYDMSQNL